MTMTDSSPRKEIKKGVRTLAVASAPVKGKRSTLAIGVVQKEYSVEGVLSTRIEVDGDDASAKIAKMLSRSRFAQQVKIIALDGAAIAGLNIVDPDYLKGRLGVHLLFITRHKPRSSALKRAIIAFGKEKGKSIAHKLKAHSELNSLYGFFFEGFYIVTDLSESHAKLVAESAISALRLAHIIARGVATGESKGRI